MWKNRLGYILAFSGCMILLFAYSRPFMLYSVVLLMTLAVAMYLFLRRDIRSIETVLTIAPTVKEGQEVFLSVDISSEHFFHAAGYVMAELEIRNEMFDTVEHKKFLMSLSGRRNHFEIPAETDFCGETCIECQNIWIFDLFKLFRPEEKAQGNSDSHLSGNDGYPCGTGQKHGGCTAGGRNDPEPQGK